MHKIDKPNQPRRRINNAMIENNHDTPKIDKVKKIRIKDVDIDENDPVQCLDRTNTLNRFPNKKPFKDIAHRDKILRSYLDDNVNSPQDKGKPSSFTQGKNTTIQSHPHPSHLRQKGSFGAPDLHHQFMEEPHFEHCLLLLIKNN